MELEPTEALVLERTQKVHVVFIVLFMVLSVWSKSVDFAGQIASLSMLLGGVVEAFMNPGATPIDCIKGVGRAFLSFVGFWIFLIATFTLMNSS